MSGTKKYEIIKKDLQSQIENKILPADSELPSENELIETYNVSRITVRRAIDELEREGFIYKQQGKRGCVREIKKTQELDNVFSYTEEIVRQGMTPSRRVLNFNLRLCNSKECSLLKLDKADAVFHLERIIFADNKPLCFTQTSLPYKYFRDIENYDFRKNSLYNVLEKEYTLKIKSSVINLKAVSAKKEIAEYLNIDENSPLLHTDAITYGEINGQELPIEYFKSYYRTDMIEYRLLHHRF